MLFFVHKSKYLRLRAVQHALLAISQRDRSVIRGSDERIGRAAHGATRVDIGARQRLGIHDPAVAVAREICWTLFGIWGGLSRRTARSFNGFGRTGRRGHPRECGAAVVSVGEIRRHLLSSRPLLFSIGVDSGNRPEFVVGTNVCRNVGRILGRGAIDGYLMRAVGNCCRPFIVWVEFGNPCSFLAFGRIMVSPIAASQSD